MKYIIVLTLLIFSSCVDPNVKDMLGDDYRLYKNTSAWPLAQAVEDEDTFSIRNLIVDKHIFVDSRDPKYNQTLLMLAVRTNKEKSVKTLLELGANPNAHDDSLRYFGENAVIIASRFTLPSSKILGLLLKYGGNPNSTTCGVQRNNLGKTVPIRAFALGEAVFISFTKVILLVNAGADIDYSTSTDGSAIENCMINDRMDIMLYLLKKGADFHRKFSEIDMSSPNYSSFDVDILYKLRKCIYPLNSKEYHDKMLVVDFLKKHGLDYRNSPIPNNVYDIIKRDISPQDEQAYEHYLKYY